MQASYTLKKKMLKAWVYQNNFTLYHIAKILHLSFEELKEKLNKKIPFTKSQIKTLVYFMGARSSFEVIYFHSVEQRKKIYEEVFGKEMVNNKCIQQQNYKIK